MKRIGFIDARRVKGRLPNVVLVPSIKRDSVGAVVMVKAPNTKATVTGGVAKTMVTSPTLGVTGTGGRNFLVGQFSCKGTGAQTLAISVKSLAGTKSIATCKGTPTASTKTTVTLPIPMVAPITLVLKGTGVTKVKTIIAKSLSVNAITTAMM